MIESWLVAIRDHASCPPATQTHVLTNLALRLDWRTGRGFASERQLVEDTGADGRTVRRATKWARDHGLLKQVSRGRRLGNGQTRASEWALCISTGQQSPVEPDPSSSQPATRDPLRANLNRTGAKLNRTAATRIKNLYFIKTLLAINRGGLATRHEPPVRARRA